MQVAAGALHIGTSGDAQALLTKIGRAEQEPWWVESSGVVLNDGYKQVLKEKSAKK